MAGKATGYKVLYLLEKDGYVKSIFQKGAEDKLGWIITDTETVKVYSLFNQIFIRWFRYILFGEDMPFDYSIALFLFFAALLALLMFLLGRSVYYSLKGRRQEEVRSEYKAQTVEKETRVEVTPEDAVKAVLIQRIDGIKNKNAKAIVGLVDRDRYTKFDDWPPFERQDLTALKREADALKVLKEYDYETTNWKIDIFGDTALASFIISYRGTIRDLEFSVRSRVTAFLVRQEEAWKLVHEHWSRFHEP